MIRILFLAGLFAAIATSACHSNRATTAIKDSAAGHDLLPAELVAGRFIVTPVTMSGQNLRIFTDTGGASFLYESAVKRNALRVEKTEVEGQTFSVTALPVMRNDKSIPGISAETDPRAPIFRGKLFVRTPEQDVITPSYDGMLGQEWFGGRIWTFDYLEARLLLHSTSGAIMFPPEHTVALGFLTNQEGRRATHFPSIEAAIDGETHAFLFDTGASVTLSDSALRELGDGMPRERATSFVTKGVFERWRKRHPDWRVIGDADENADGAPMIQVPRVDIAGHSVGPVWFTRREDANFHNYMSSMMDRKVEGALGGSLFQFFIIHVDYPGARAAFNPWNEGLAAD